MMTWVFISFFPAELPSTWIFDLFNFLLSFFIFEGSLQAVAILQQFVGKEKEESKMSTYFIRLVVLMATLLSISSGFSIISPPSKLATNTVSATTLYMSDRERTKSTKKGVKTIIRDKTESKAEEQKKKEEMWRVVLHNDEVHTFNYVIRSLCKVVGTLDRKASFEICVQTHGVGKATVTKTWKKQAEQFCLGLQRQGLTVSISPDEDFDGGHSGGGL